MIVKQKFDLLKDIDNVLKLSKSELDNISIDRGPRKIFVMLELMSTKINHYTKDRVFRTISDLKGRENIHVVSLPSYPLPVSYNTPTKGSIINLSPFGVDDVETTKPGPFNLYALMVYSIVFSDLASNKVSLSDKYAPVISSFFDSILIRLFGKEYGLLGSFSTQIPKMKFLSNLYILTSFFGITGQTAYKRAAASSAYNYKEIESMLGKYNFLNINDFIRALSELAVMPNLNRHIFASKCLRFFGLNVMPAFEDCSRFIATISTADIKGSNVISTYISKYNEREFGKLIEISKSIFKRS